MKMELHIINNNSYVTWKTCSAKPARIFVTKLIREIPSGEDLFVRSIQFLNPKQKKNIKKPNDF